MSWAIPFLSVPPPPMEGPYVKIHGFTYGWGVNFYDLFKRPSSDAILLLLYKVSKILLDLFL